ERCAGLFHASQNRNRYAARLLRSFQKNFLPALRALLRRMEQRLFTPRGGERNNTVDTQLGRLLQRPLERIEFYDRQEQRRLKRSCPAGNRLHQLEGHFVTSSLLDASKPGRFTVT